MRFYIISVLICFPLILHAQLVNIPDVNFKTAILNHNPIIDTNGDNELQLSEALAFDGTLNVGNAAIDDLTGIEAFENIGVLLCQFNNLTSLDITQNVHLTFVRADTNALTQIDLPQSTTLSSLQISANQLSNLDVSMLSNLNQLFARGNNITTLSLASNSILTALNLSENPVSALNLTATPLLQFLDISGSAISSLDLSQNPDLVILRASSLDISDLDLSNNSEIRLLDISDTNLSSFDFSIVPNLQFVEAAFTQMETLDFSENPLLCRVFIESNELLVSVNLANGNNVELINPSGCGVSSGQVSVNGPSGLFALNNPNLLEICVDAINFAEENFSDIPTQTTFIDNCLLGLSDTISDTCTLYPNPASTYLHLESTFPIDAISIYDVLGRKVHAYSLKDTIIDISELNTGLYFIQVNAVNNTQTVRFIKE